MFREGFLEIELAGLERFLRAETAFKELLLLLEGGVGEGHRLLCVDVGGEIRREFGALEFEKGITLGDDCAESLVIIFHDPCDAGDDFDHVSFVEPDCSGGLDDLAECPGLHLGKLQLEIRDRFGRKLESFTGEGLRRGQRKDEKACANGCRPRDGSEGLRRKGFHECLVREENGFREVFQ